MDKRTYGRKRKWQYIILVFLSGCFFSAFGWFDRYHMQDMGVAAFSFFCLIGILMIILSIFMFFHSSKAYLALTARDIEISNLPLGGVEKIQIANIQSYYIETEGDILIKTKDGKRHYLTCYHGNDQMEQFKIDLSARIGTLQKSSIQEL